MANTGKRPDYFEAIIQLRPLDEEAFNWIFEEVDRRRNVSIAKVEKVKGGVDLYISDQKFARSLAPRFKKKFGGEIKTTRSLFGYSRDKGKRVYRVTVLMRLE